MTARRARAVVFTGDRQAHLDAFELPPLGARDVLVRTELSAISAGTELLFYRGLIEPDVAIDPALPGFREPTTYPLRYGYAAVGTIAQVGAEIDPARVGRRVFAYRPHQEAFVCGADQLVDIADDIDPVRACMLASMETAVTLMMDGAPMIGESMAVVGQGVIGLLTGALAAHSLASEVSVIDRYRSRLELARALSGTRVRCLQPGDAAAAVGGGLDLAIDASSHASGLQLALDLLGFGGRLIAGSWLSPPELALRLGARAHRNRQTISFSQVSTLAPALSGRFDRARRHAVAVHWLRRLPVDALVTDRVPLDAAQEIYRKLDERPESTGQVVLVHSWEG